MRIARRVSSARLGGLRDGLRVRGAVSARCLHASSPPFAAAAAVATPSPPTAPAPSPTGGNLPPPPGQRGIQSLVLYQYDSCPFCNKARAYFDFAGIPYIVVEVNPLLKSEVAWARDWGKVPIAVVNGVRVVDSSAIIDYCEELLRRQQQGDAGTSVAVTDGGPPPLGSGSEEEARWRAWVDSTLVRLLSPNIYRSLPEAWEAFRYMTQRNFSPAAAVLPARVVGSLAMWGLSGRLKARYGITGDVRVALYAALDEWVDSGVGEGRPFLGGARPNLADAAVWGVLRSVRGLSTETDMLAHSRIGGWHARMAAALEEGGGSRLVHRVGEAPPQHLPQPRGAAAGMTRHTTGQAV